MPEFKPGKRIIVPTIHFLLSFAWEWLVLVPSDRAAVAFSIPLNDIFSYGFEQVMCYVISKIMAVIIIFLLWKLVFDAFDKKIDRETVAVFGTILIVGAMITVILWPDVFEAGGDNYIPYSYAIRLMPEYWHSIYLSCLYTASVMVFPHAVSINVLQMTAFVVAVGYLYSRIKNSKVLGNARFLRFAVLIMFVLRDSFTVATNPERAEYNASFTLLFVSAVLMDILEKKVRSRREFAVLLVFAAFLAVFRSEGIVVAILSFAVLVVLVYKPGLLKASGIFALLIALVVCFKLPAKVGDIKYYGSDYSIVNSFNPLHNIFCAESANLSYEGAEADLAAIEAITPVELIKEFGSEGYRRFNYAAGRVDFNQSAAGAAVSSAYRKAYVNIVRHNLGIYVKTQLHMLLQAAGVRNAEYIEAYTGNGTGMQPFGQELWEVGRNDYQTVPGRFIWVNNGIRNKIAMIFTVPRLKYVDFLTESFAYTTGLAIEMLFGIFIVIDTIVRLIKKKPAQLAAGILALILSGFVLLLALVMPVGANMYFHAYIYSMLAVIIVYCAGALQQRRV